ncbi:MAG: 4-hydroxybenzoate octaprenyltransferase [Gammaproteobacteria bacterium]|nr:4-hydroxybenzoate octaprenyltransferase [Gammaproteobacteria bacterium]
MWDRWSPVLKERGAAYSRLCRLHKPIGIFLLLWPTLWALWIAATGWPDPAVLTVFVAGVILMRSAGCVLNDLADRKFDGYVERTRERPLVTGEVRVLEALALTGVLVMLAFLLVLTTNRLTVQLAFVAVILAIVYPFMKRFTYLPQFVLGLAFGWSIPMAFAAQTGAVPPIAWLLLLGNVLWSVSYDTMYAMVDREDDLRIGVKSTAILFDDADRLIIGTIQVMLLLVLVLLGDQLKLGIFYYAGVLLAAIMAAYQQILIRDRQPENCFRAFLNNNWLGAAVFLGLFMNYQFS